MSLRTRAALAAATVALALAIAHPAVVAGQSGAPARGAVVGTGVFTSFVENMDRSLAFYHDVFDMEVPALPASGARPYNPANPRLFAMFQINGARERHQSARVTGTRLALEFMEIQDVDHKAVNLRIQDPGTATPAIVVRNIDPVLARVKQVNAAILTPGGAPMTLANGSRAMIIRDVDGRPVAIVQPASTPASASEANIVDIRLLVTVNDMNATLRVYRDVLGFTESENTNDPEIPALTGVSKATARRARVQAPESPLAIIFLEFTGVERTPLRMRIQDRGAARLQVRAQNVDALVDAMKAAGLRVISEGGVAVPIPPNFKGALVEDPNNFFLTPFEPCDGCAPTAPNTQ
jgi:catechol 2,3-dioxygenase-like lactoylglutathione lyase family enzyme